MSVIRGFVSACSVLPWALATSCVGPEPSIQGPERPPPHAPPEVLEKPPTPDTDDRDWIRLTSGEWLRGTIRGLRKKDLSFDSAGLDALRLGWGKVVEIRSKGTWSIRTIDGEVLSGRLGMENGIVTIADEAGVQRLLPRRDLLRIVPDQLSELDHWSGRLSLGFTGREGNTSQTDYTASTQVERVTVQSRWSTEFRSTLSEIEGTRTADNQRLQSRWDRFVTDRLFLVPAGIDVYRDTFQNVALRVTPYAAIGYDVLDGSALDLSVSTGPAYLYERRESTTLGEDESEGAFAIITSSRMGWDVSADVDLSVVYDITVSFPSSATFNHHFAAVLGLDLIGDFDLDVQLVWDRIQDPAIDDAGRRPERDDLRLTVGLGWQF